MSKINPPFIFPRKILDIFICNIYIKGENFVKSHYQLHFFPNKLKCEKNPISNACLGGCTITTKTKNQRFFGNFFFTPGLIRGPSTRKDFNKCQFLPLRQTLHCPTKMHFFPRFSSLWHRWFLIKITIKRNKVSNNLTERIFFLRFE